MGIDPAKMRQLLELSMMTFTVFIFSVAILQALGIWA